MQDIKDSIVINYEQQRSIVELIDNYIDLIKSSRKSYCCQPDKRYNSKNEEVCSGECEKCENEYYGKYRKFLIENVGLSYLTDEEGLFNADWK